MRTVNATAYTERREKYFAKVRALIAMGAYPVSVIEDAERMFALCGGCGLDAIEANCKVDYVINTPIAELSRK